MHIKKKDFIELEYTGKLKDENIIFDTTDEKIAKDSEIHNPKALYGPVVICVGENHVLRGLDEALEGKEPGNHKIELTADKAFGKKDAKLIQMIPLNKFNQQEIRPFPGLQINIDGVMGTIRTVSGGRVLVDFNHPLSGKDLIYEVKINKIVDDKKTQIDALMKMLLGIKDAAITIENNIAKIKLKAELPKQISEELIKKIAELTGINTVEFAKEDKKEEKKTEAKKEADKTQQPKTEKKPQPEQKA